MYYYLLFIIIYLPSIKLKSRKFNRGIIYNTVRNNSSATTETQILTTINCQHGINWSLFENRQAEAFQEAARNSEIGELIHNDKVFHPLSNNGHMAADGILFFPYASIFIGQMSRFYWSLDIIQLDDKKEYVISCIIRARVEDMGYMLAATFLIFSMGIMRKWSLECSMLSSAWNFQYNYALNDNFFLCLP